MFDLPDTYRVDVNVVLKDFIPTDLKPNEKKRIKDAVKFVRLGYQIAGEEIPSVNNEEYRCQVIQFYDIEVANIKEANFLAATYQNLIKPLCVLHMHDTKDEVYSMAVKRLNQTDETQIVVEQTLLTDKYMLGIPDSNRDRLMAYMNYATLKNKNDKVQLYKGWTKELNKISWNGGEPKYDIRDWAPEHEKMGKGVTLTHNEAEKLSALLKGNL